MSHYHLSMRVVIIVLGNTVFGVPVKGSLLLLMAERACYS
jgi:hypothetical protein